MEALAVYTTDIELLTNVMCVVVHCVSSSCFVLSQFFVVHTQVGQSHDQSINQSILNRHPLPTPRGKHHVCFYSIYILHVCVCVC